jgi:hypothetical protein
MSTIAIIVIAVVVVVLLLFVFRLVTQRRRIAREREIRRREAEEARRTFAPPLHPIGFSEGLAAFTSSRSRRAAPPRRPR